MNKVIVFILINIFTLGSVFAELQVKTAVAVKTGKSPVIDGVIANDEWKGAFWHNSFVAYPGDSMAKQQSRFAVMFDKANIYIAVKCDEIHMDKVKPYRKNDVSIWQHAGLEFMLQHEGEKKEHLQFLTSAGGSGYGLKFITKAQNTKHEIPDAKWQRAAKRNESGYIVEVKISFALFGGKVPSNGTEWRFNILRNALTLDSDRFSTWSPVSDFHAPVSFGYLIFAFSEAHLIKQRVNAKRKFNTLASRIEIFQGKYAKFDSAFAHKLNAELKRINWLRFKAFGTSVMTMNKVQLEAFCEKLLAFSGCFEKLKQMRSEYLLNKFLK